MRAIGRVGESAGRALRGSATMVVVVIGLFMLMGADSCDYSGTDYASARTATKEPATRATPTSPPARPDPRTVAYYDCGDIALFMPDLSQERTRPGDRILLKIYAIEETSRTGQRIDCKGAGRWSNGLDSPLTFYMEADADGDLFHGFREGKPTPTPQPTVPPETFKRNCESTGGMVVWKENPLQGRFMSCVPRNAAGPASETDPGTSATDQSNSRPLIPSQGSKIINTGGLGVSIRDGCNDDARTDGAWPEGLNVAVVAEGTGECSGWSFLESRTEASWVRNDYLIPIDPPQTGAVADAFAESIANDPEAQAELKRRQTMSSEEEEAVRAQIEAALRESLGLDDPPPATQNPPGDETVCGSADWWEAYLDALAELDNLQAGLGLDASDAELAQFNAEADRIFRKMIELQRACE